MTDLDWPCSDQAAACTEGWDIFASGDDEHEPYELCRLDDPLSLGLGYAKPKFSDDAEAWEHVIARATAGSPLHNRALAFLAEYAPGELVHIWTWRYSNPSDQPCPCAACNREETEP